MKENLILTWSGGKDSTLTLLKLQRAYRYDVVHLLTTINVETRRSIMHNIPEALLIAQAESIGLPLEVVELSPDASNDEYEDRLGEALAALRGTKIDQVAYGDIYLEDIREYRETHLARIGMKGVYPLWGRDPVGLADEVVALGIEAVVCCVDSTLLDVSFVGRKYDRDFLNDLPKYVDPCGENGEFHTFVSHSPAFARPVKYTLGEPYREQNRFAYMDLLPID